MELGKTNTGLLATLESKNKLLDPPLWRIVEEHSSMINNDEWIRYVREKPTDKFRLMRPVFQVEVDNGLDVSFTGLKRKPWINEAHAEPKVTNLIDAVYDVAKTLNWVIKTDQLPISKAIAYSIGTEYYDAMSGGMSYYKIQIIMKLMELYPDHFDMEDEVYPGGRGQTEWVKLKNWLEEVEKTTSADKVDELGFNMKMLEG